MESFALFLSLSISLILFLFYSLSLSFPPSLTHSISNSTSHFTAHSFLFLACTHISSHYMLMSVWVHKCRVCVCIHMFCGLTTLCSTHPQPLAPLHHFTSSRAKQMDATYAPNAPSLPVSPGALLFLSSLSQTQNIHYLPSESLPYLCR